MPKQCMFDGCDRAVLALDMCAPCYQRTRSWNDRTVAEKLQRKKNLRLYERTMDFALGNVRDIDSGKKKKVARR